MTLWWIGSIVLLVGRSSRWSSTCFMACWPRRRASSPRSTESRPSAQAGSKDLDAVALLATTQKQAAETVAVVADYGGSLDVIVDDAEGE